MALKIEKTPAECANKDEIRLEIDRIDREIIELFALRFDYVKSIVKFKNDKEAVVAQERKDLVINQRAKWANEMGLDEQTFEHIFRTLIDSNIKKEMAIFDKSQMNKI